jgi:hypothetical protein
MTKGKSERTSPGLERGGQGEKTRGKNKKDVKVGINKTT